MEEKNVREEGIVKAGIGFGYDISSKSYLFLIFYVLFFFFIN